MERLFCCYIRKERGVMLRHSKHEGKGQPLLITVVMLNLFQHPIIQVASCLASGVPK